MKQVRNKRKVMQTIRVFLVITRLRLKSWSNPETGSRYYKAFTITRDGAFKLHCKGALQNPHWHFWQILIIPAPPLLPPLTTVKISRPSLKPCIGKEASMTKLALFGQNCHVVPFEFVDQWALTTPCLNTMTSYPCRVLRRRCGDGERGERRGK